jgi:hypothetical protein
MTITGSISGSVLDPTGKAVPSAKITLISETTKDRRGTSTNESGIFNLVAVPAGTYMVKAEHPGFKALERTGIVVTANERIALGELSLQCGAI